MSQMKPYCFKCGAELDPEAIYCPECGRLQRSMVVRAVEPGAPSAPPRPGPGQQPDQPPQFHPARAPQPGQPAEPPPDQGWYAGEQAPGHAGHDQNMDYWEAQPAQPEPPAPGGDQGNGQSDRHDAPDQGQWPEPAHDPYAARQPHDQPGPDPAQPAPS